MTNCASTSHKTDYTPKELAGIVQKNFGAHLSFQEALLFSLLVRLSGLITYERIEAYMWAVDSAPLSPRRAIHVVVHRLRQKVPIFRACCEDGQGYRCPVTLADVKAGFLPQGHD